MGLQGGGDDLEIIRGDAYYQSYICHIPRSTIELGLNGSFDCLDGMLVPRHLRRDPQPLRASGRCMFPEKLVRYLDVPQDFDPAWEAPSTLELTRLAAGAPSARRQAARPPRRCASAIALYNENRQVRETLYDLRGERALEGARPASSTWCCAPGS